MILNFKFNQESKYTLKELNRKRKKKEKAYLCLFNSLLRKRKAIQDIGRTWKREKAYAYIYLKKKKKKKTTTTTTTTATTTTNSIPNDH